MPESEQKPLLKHLRKVRNIAGGIILMAAGTACGPTNQEAAASLPSSQNPANTTETTVTPQESSSQAQLVVEDTPTAIPTPTTEPKVDLKQISAPVDSKSSKPDPVKASGQPSASATVNTNSSMEASVSAQPVPVAKSEASAEPSVAPSVATKTEKEVKQVDIASFYKLLDLMTVPGVTKVSDFANMPDIGVKFKEVRNDGTTLYPTFDNGHRRGQIIVDNKGIVIFESEITLGRDLNVTNVQNNPAFKQLGQYVRTIPGYDATLNLGPNGKMLLYDKAALSVQGDSVQVAWGFPPTSQTDFLREWGKLIHPAGTPQK